MRLGNLIPTTLLQEYAAALRDLEASKQLLAPELVVRYQAQAERIRQAVEVAGGKYAPSKKFWVWVAARVAEINKMVHRDYRP